MKRWLTKFLALAVATIWVAGAAFAQPYVKKGDGSTIYGGAPNVPLISGFDSIEEDTTFWGQYGFWDPDTDCLNQGPPCWDFYENERDYLWVDEYTSQGGSDHPQGANALWMDWSVFSDQGWGGSSALQHILPDTTVEKGIYYDFSDFTEIGISYNTLSPASGETFFRIKINEGSDQLPSEGTEDWYSEDKILLNDTPGWKETFVPLDAISGCCSMDGFNRPGWSGVTGNDQFDADKIVGFQLEFVATADQSQGDSVVAGLTVWDNFRVRGVRWNTISDFEGPPSSDGKQSNDGTYTLSNSTDAILGEKSLQVDYSVVGDQGWGGEVDLFFESDGDNFGPMASRTGITVFYKVLSPATAGMNFGLRVFENSDGNESIWNYEQSDVLTDETGKWRRFLAPFSEMSVPGWCNCTHDGILDQDKIYKVQFVLYTGQGNTAVGSILFDRMTGYGFQESDFTAPEAVTGFSATASDYANLISWTDVPGEDGETYTIYVSSAPITDIAAPGVGVLMADVEEGTEVITDKLWYPVVDGPTTFYYAITAKDAAGNVSDPTIFDSAVNNTGKAMVTVNLGAPAGFAADGVLTDWAGITPIHIEDGTDIGHVFLAAPVENAADLSADIYLAMDNDYLYYAFDVTDQVYDPVPDTETDQRWMYDGGEMYIGLYDGRDGKHAGFQGGSAADFKFYQYKQDFRSDQIASPIFTSGDGNYQWVQSANGWIAEGWISFATMKRDDGDLFVPMNGMRIPLDIVIMDDDTADGARGRESALAYSPYNNDNSYLSPRNWFYTWIGDQYSVSTGVEQVAGDVPSNFKLHTNYPNPFNPSTMFRYELPQSGRVTLRVFNTLGQEVRTLVNTDQAAGVYEVRFDATDLASGVYLYTLQAGNFLQTKSMILVR